MYKAGHIRNKQKGKEKQTKKEHEPCLLTAVYSCSFYLHSRKLLVFHVNVCTFRFASNGVWPMEEKEKKYIVLVSNGRWCNCKSK